MFRVAMTTYVLIPGAGGAAWYWHRLVPELQQRGHDVVAVSLPAGDDSAGLAEYADAVIDAIGDHSELILVAQSLAGFTAPLVCERLPVDLLVLLNAMVPADVTAEAMAAGAPVRSPTPFTQPCPLTAWPDVPTRFTQGRDDRFFPVEFQRRVVRDRLGVTPDEMPTAQLGRPVSLLRRTESRSGPASQSSTSSWCLSRTMLRSAREVTAAATLSAFSWWVRQAHRTMWSRSVKNVDSGGSRFPFHRTVLLSRRSVVRRTTRPITTARGRSSHTSRSARCRSNGLALPYCHSVTHVG